jgi:hypothetical protein
VTFRGPQLAAAAVAVVLMLCGCTSSHPVPPGPSEADIADYLDQLSEQHWDFADLDDSIERPRVAVVRFVKPEEWGRSIANCMNEAGYAGYRAVGGGLESTQPAAADLPGEAIAMYTCQSQFPFDPSLYGIVSGAQLELLYDYYARFLVPCLAVRGYDRGDPPSREAFLEMGAVGLWSPYWWVQEPDAAAYERLQRACPPRPAWLRE